MNGFDSFVPLFGQAHGTRCYFLLALPSPNDSLRPIYFHQAWVAESGQPLESIARAAALKAARPSLLQNPSQTLQRHAVVAASLKEFVAKLRTATGERAPLQESRSRTPGAGDMRETIIEDLL